MADVAADEETIEREERQLIHSIFEFGDTVVREVMLPRPDMVAIDADATVEEAIERAIEGGLLALPVLRGRHRQHHRARVPEGPRRGRAPGEGDATGARRALRPAMFVPEQKRVAELLREMQSEQFHMAIVDRRVRRDRRPRHPRGPARGDRGRDHRRVRRRGARASSSSTTARCGCPGACRSTTSATSSASSCPTPSGTPSAGWCSTCSATCPRRARPCASRASSSAPSGCRGGASCSVRITPVPRRRRRRAERPRRRPTRPTRRARATRERVPIGLRLAGRTAQRRQVDARQPARRHEGRDRLRPAADDAHADPRRAHDARRSQLVLLDTPGIHKPRTLLGERTNHRARATLAEVDVVCLLIEATAPIGPGDRFVADLVRPVATPSCWS